MTTFRRDLMERVRCLIQDMVLNDSLVIAEDTNVSDIPEWDSMLHVTLVMGLENEFKVRMSTKEASETVSIRAILDILEAKLNNDGRGTEDGSRSRLG